LTTIHGVGTATVAQAAGASQARAVNSKKEFMAQNLLNSEKGKGILALLIG
jgi:hypothetical protein